MPDEILSEIFMNLSAADVHVAGEVCKLWMVIVRGLSDQVRALVSYVNVIGALSVEKKVLSMSTAQCVLLNQKHRANFLNGLKSSEIRKRVDEQRSVEEKKSYLESWLKNPQIADTKRVTHWLSLDWRAPSGALVLRTRSKAPPADLN